MNNVSLKNLSVISQDYSFLIDLLQLLIKNNIIPGTSLRNFEIKKDYIKLTKEGSAKKARQILADRYFLSDKCIQNIIYNKRK